MTSNMILPVDSKLKVALVKAHTVLDQLEQTESHKRSDRIHYSPVVEALNGLVTSLLAANAGNFLTVRKTVGARFDMGPNTTLAHSLNECVGYLRDTASSLVLDKGLLSTYHTEHTSAAANLLKALYGQTLGSVLRMAKQDLNDAYDRGPTDLLGAAEFLYGAANPAD